MNIRFEKKYSGNLRAFTLIELLVSIFIFSLIMISVVAVFASTVRAYSKAKAMKTLKESMEFAIGSIAKDVRMGKIESANTGGVASSTLEITRNQGQVRICYRKTANGLEVCESGGCACPSGNWRKIIDLAGTGMSFSSTSGFLNQKTEPVPPADPTIRGWVEMNFNVDITAGQEMAADTVDVQAIVSSRDYGWEDMAP
jgi:type II secretory pathway pseudopilin PulG